MATRIELRMILPSTNASSWITQRTRPRSACALALLGRAAHIRLTHAPSHPPPRPHPMPSMYPCTDMHPPSGTHLSVYLCVCSRVHPLYPQLQHAHTIGVPRFFMTSECVVSNAETTGATCGFLPVQSQLRRQFWFCFKSRQYDVSLQDQDQSPVSLLPCPYVRPTHRLLSQVSGTKNKKGCQRSSGTTTMSNNHIHDVISKMHQRGLRPFRHQHLPWPRPDQHSHHRPRRLPASPNTTRRRLQKLRR